LIKIALSFFIVGTIILFANDNYELKLYENILPAIFKTTPIKVYADKNIAKLLSKSKNFVITSICDQSVSLIIGKNFKNISYDCQDKPLFATSYRWYKNYKNSIGAFYWRKGRPQLKFKRKALNRFNIELPKELLKYAQ